MNSHKHNRRMMSDSFEETNSKPVEKNYSHSDEITNYPNRQLNDRISKVQMVPIEHIIPTENSEESKVKGLTQHLNSGGQLPAIITEFAYNDKNPDLDALAIVDGHHRLEAARRMGMTHVPVRIRVPAEDWESVKQSGGFKLNFGKSKKEAPSLHKAPIEYSPEEHGISTHPIKNPNESWTQIHEQELPNGLVYKQFQRDDAFQHHIVDPSTNKSVSTLHTRAVGHPDYSRPQEHAITWAQTDPSQKGRGLGKQAYLAALVHGKGVKQLYSGTELSLKGHKAWSGLKNTSGLKVNLAPYAVDQDAQLDPEFYNRAASQTHSMKIVNPQELDHGKMFPQVDIGEKKLAASEEAVIGGKGDRKKDSDFNPKQVKMGHRVEMEHTSSPKIAAEITRDHLTENPKYYSKLKQAGLADELNKGAHGDWQKEGYKIEHEPEMEAYGFTHPNQFNPKKHNFKVYAKDKQGNKVGELEIQHGENHIESEWTKVHDDHQRKGLASAMYSHAEKISGKKMEPAYEQSLEGERFWAQPNRPFGKSELEKANVKPKPRFVGDISEDQQNIGIQHPQIGLTWDATPEIKRHRDEKTIATAREWLKTQNPEHHQLLKDFINHVMQSPNRHLRFGSDYHGGPETPKQRHIYQMVQNHPDTQLTIHSPNSLTLSVKRHGTMPKISSFHFDSEKKIAKSDSLCYNGLYGHYSDFSGNGHKFYIDGSRLDSILRKNETGNESWNGLLRFSRRPEEPVVDRICDLLKSLGHSSLRGNVWGELQKGNERSNGAPRGDGTLLLKSQMNKPIKIAIKDLVRDTFGDAGAHQTFVFNKNPKISSEPVSVAHNVKTGKLHLVDGYHRVLAAEKRGDTHILANVHKDAGKMEYSKEGYGTYRQKLLSKSQMSPKKYSLKYHAPKGQGAYGLHTVTAHDHLGNVVGELSAEDLGDGTFQANMVEVHPEHRRKGIAGAMYDHMQSKTKLNAVPDLEAQTSDARKFWASRKINKSESVFESLQKASASKKLLGMLGLAAATTIPMSMPSDQKPVKEFVSPQVQQYVSSPDQKRDVDLNAIAQVESRGGKDTKHKVITTGPHAGSKASGSYGLMPLTIKDLVSKEPALKKYKGVLNQNDSQIHNLVAKHPTFEKDVASAYYDKLNNAFNGDINNIAHAWLNGKAGTNRAIEKGKKIQDHWHVKKVVKERNKLLGIYTPEEKKGVKSKKQEPSRLPATNKIKMP